MYLLLNMRDFCHVLPPEGIDLGSAGPCRGLAAWSFKVPEICESRGRLQLWWGFFLVAKSQVRKVFFKEWRKSKVKLRSYPLIYHDLSIQWLTSDSRLKSKVEVRESSPNEGHSFFPVTSEGNQAIDSWIKSIEPSSAHIKQHHYNRSKPPKADLMDGVWCRLSPRSSWKWTWTMKNFFPVWLNPVFWSCSFTISVRRSGNCKCQ